MSSVPDELSSDVGGLQNTATSLGAPLGTALAGSLLIAGLTAAFVASVTSNPTLPSDVSAAVSGASVAGLPFVSDAALTEALADAGVSEASQAMISSYGEARLVALRTALAVVARPARYSPCSSPAVGRVSSPDTAPLRRTSPESPTPNDRHPTRLAP